jgi:hypothetical protein
MAKYVIIVNVKRHSLYKMQNYFVNLFNNKHNIDERKNENRGPFCGNGKYCMGKKVAL